MTQYSGKLKRAVVKEELVALTGDALSAMILNQLLYWSERTNDFDNFIKEEKERVSDTEIPLTHGWIYKKTDDLKDELMTPASFNTIRRRMRVLVENGWVNVRRNPDHGWDQTLQYRPDILAIQRDLFALGYALEGYKLQLDISSLHSENSDFPGGGLNFPGGGLNLHGGGLNLHGGGALPEITTEITTEITSEELKNHVPPPSAGEPDRTKTQKFGDRKPIMGDTDEPEYVEEGDEFGDKPIPGKQPKYATPDTDLARRALFACGRKGFLKGQKMAWKKIEKGMFPFGGGIEATYPTEWVENRIEMYEDANKKGSAVKWTFATLLSAINNTEKKNDFIVRLRKDYADGSKTPISITNMNLVNMTEAEALYEAGVGRAMTEDDDEWGGLGGAMIDDDENELRQLGIIK